MYRSRVTADENAQQPAPRMLSSNNAMLKHRNNSCCRGPNTYSPSQPLLISTALLQRLYRFVLTSFVTAGLKTVEP